MWMLTIIAICLLVFALIYFISIYNEFVDLRNMISKHWANIKVILSQRNSEILKLVAICQQHMGYEEQTINLIIQARNKHNRSN